MNYEVKELFFGKPMPQVVQVSFELAYSDWCELQASKLWLHLVESGSRPQKEQSYGFSTTGYQQVVVFNDEEDFRRTVVANPNMTAIMGADGHTAESFPGVFLAGVMATSRMDISVGHVSATLAQHG